MSVIGVCGFAQSGKDTAAGFLIERGWKRLAFADALRESVYELNPIAYVALGVENAGYRDQKHVVTTLRVQDIVAEMGWDVAKVEFPEIRQLLQRMGTEVGRGIYGESFWVDRVLAQIEPDQNYVITDVRFPNEVDAVRSVGGVVYRIYREGVGAVNGHISDTGVDDLEIDGILLNDGDLADLESRVLAAVGL